MTLENDFNTLIGEMEDNLQAMGVLDAEFDPTTGLRGLTARILDIEPSIGGLDLDTAVNITANPSTIIVGQSIILTSKLTASYDDETIVDVDLTGVLTGATIQYKEGNTVLGTGITDNTGVATCTVSGLTLGTHTVKAVFQGTENFNDCESSNITVTVNNPEPASLTLEKTGGKQILSYADSAGGKEFCELTCTVLDAGGNPLPSILIDVYKNNVFWHTIESDSAGEITILYESEGAGDVSFKAECGSLVTETFVVQDLHKYDSGATDNTSKYSTLNANSFIHSTDHYELGRTLSSSDTSRYYTVAYLTDYNLPTNYELSVDFLTTDYYNQDELNIVSAPTGTYQNANEFGIISTGVRYGLFNRVNGTGTWYTTDGHLNSNNWYTFIIKVEGTTVTATIKNGATTVFTNSKTISNASSFKKFTMICGNNAHTIKFKNLKVKAL